MDSSFFESPTDEHVRLRRLLLDSGAVLPAPHVEPVLAQATRIPDGLADNHWSALRESGLLVLQLDEPLSNERFLALGEMLGTAMAETAPAVKPYVEDGVILNLVNEHAETPNVDLQPFATNSLTLHTEGSGRRVEEQPRNLVLMCCQPGNATEAQTVLIPMHAVERRMSRDSLTALSRTRYRNSTEGPWIVRNTNGRCVFSFRDFQSQTLDWTHVGPLLDPDTINASIRNLLAAMYSWDQAAGIHWASGLIVILDNTFYFHGRTSASSATTGSRHLKRLRILARKSERVSSGSAP